MLKTIGLLYKTKQIQLDNRTLPETKEQFTAPQLTSFEQFSFSTSENRFKFSVMLSSVYWFKVLAFYYCYNKSFPGKCFYSMFYIHHHFSKY